MSILPISRKSKLQTEKIKVITLITIILKVIGWGRSGVWWEDETLLITLEDSPERLKS